jgi:hypothetical protein
VTRLSVIPLLLAALLLPAAKCGGGSGSKGKPARVTIESPDLRCAALPEPFGFPPGFDFLPGDPDPGLVLAATFARPSLLTLNVRRVPFRAAAGTHPYHDLALVTLSGYEAVLFVDPAGEAVRVELATPPSYPDWKLRLWPEAGQSDPSRTGIPNFPCVVPPAGARDSRGELLSRALDPADWCREGQPSFTANFSSGAAVAADHLFVSVSNLGEDRGQENTQYLPGAVAVYGFDRSGARPRLSPAEIGPEGIPILFTSPGSFNATHVQAYTTPGGRELVLVTMSGAIGIPEDDPDTQVLEGGALRISNGSVEVIDAQTLRLVASIPLRRANPSFRGLAIDPSGRVGLVGDLSARHIYAVDLAPLDSLDPAASEPVVLRQAVIFDGRDPFRVPRLPDSPPIETCPGWIESIAFNHSGDRAHALEFCDGSLVSVEVEFQAGDPVPLASSSFRPGPVEALTAPLRTDTLGLTRQPSAIQVRAGEPGVDFSGPDVFFLVGEPEGLLCGIRVESVE